MATSLRMKRMVRERKVLEKANDDYFVSYKDDDLFTFHAYVLGPADSLYEHKFIKLRIEIPERYPLIPPECTFVQHSGGRIHPNLYVEGKVCLSILGTWPGEPWALAMSVETVLITVRSLLDNAPYKHEPGKRDDKNFNLFVQYTTWKSLLMDYLRNERDPAARTFLERHVCNNGGRMIKELEGQTKTNSGAKALTSPYGRYTGTSAPKLDYRGLMADVTKMVNECRVAQTACRISTIGTTAIKVVNVDTTEVNISQPEVSADYKSQKRVGSAAPSMTETVTPTKAGHGLFLVSNLPKPRTVSSGLAIDELVTKDKIKASALKRKYEVIDLT